jgi:hypothetical protein
VRTCADPFYFVFDPSGWEIGQILAKIAEKLAEISKIPP